MRNVFGEKLRDQKEDLLTYIDSIDGVNYMHSVSCLVEYRQAKLGYIEYLLKHPVTKRVLWIAPLFKNKSPLAKGNLYGQEENKTRH